MEEEYGRHLSFPFRIGKDGRTAQVTKLEDHIREELVQLILTNPGERINLPELGGGIRRLLFENMDDVTAGMTTAMVPQALSRWLGHRVTLELLEVLLETETLTVEIRYRIAGTDDSRILRFERTGG